jgi:hypothetical protein
MSRRRRDQRIERLKAVELEARTAAVAITALSRVVQLDPSALAKHALRPANLRVFRENLQPTYLIRVFAEFESGLRDAWKHAYRRSTHPRALDLINSIAALSAVPLKWLSGVHDVREYRNGLVHEQAEAHVPVAVGEATQHLVRYFSLLPPNW